MLSCNVNRTVSHWILDSPLNYELVFRLQKLLAARHIARKTKSSYVLNETNYLDTLIITEHKPGVKYLSTLKNPLIKLMIFYSLYSWH